MQATVAATRCFERWSPKAFGDGQYYQRTINMLTRSVVRGDVLDLGCGSRVYYSLADVDRWVGLDISGTMLEKVEFLDERHPPVVEKNVQSCDSLDFPHDSFDTVCAVFLLHHLGRDSTRASRLRVTDVLRQAYELLRPGGRLVVAENAARLIEWPYHAAFPLVYRAFRRFVDVEMPHFWSVRQFTGMLKDAGYRHWHYVHIPEREQIYHPVFGLTLPACISAMLQRMTLYVAEK